MAAKIKQPGDFLLRNVRLSYPSLFTKAVYEGKETKFTTDCVIPKDSEQERLIKAEYDKAVNLALEQGVLKKNQITPWVKPVGPRTMGIMTDCDADPDHYDPENFAGCWIFKPKANKRPTVVDRQNQPIDPDSEEIYGGVRANVYCNFYIYTQNGGGISSNLQGVQKWADDDAYGAPRKSAADMFGDPADPDTYD